MEEEEKKMSLAEEALDKLKGVLVTQVVLLKSLEEEKGIPELQGRADYLSGIGYDLIGKMRLVVQNEKMQAERLEWLEEENARLEEENSQLKEENSQLKEENARLKEENVGLEQTQEEEQTPLMEYEALIEKITPWFGQDKEAASDFIRHCIGVDPTYITKMAGELWAEDILDDHHVHKRLWEALKEAGLYNYSLNNWNAQVGKAAQAKD